MIKNTNPAVTAARKISAILLLFNANARIIVIIGIGRKASIACIKAPINAIGITETTLTIGFASDITTIIAYIHANLRKAVVPKIGNAINLISGIFVNNRETSIMRPSPAIINKPVFLNIKSDARIITKSK